MKGGFVVFMLVSRRVLPPAPIGVGSKPHLKSRFRRYFEKKGSFYYVCDLRDRALAGAYATDRALAGAYASRPWVHRR